jgi:hypothetical protein
MQVWRKVIEKSGRWNLRLIKRLDPIGPDGHGSPITSILPVGSSLYTGDDNGRVVSPSFIFLYRNSVLTQTCSMNGTARSMRHEKEFPLCYCFCFLTFSSYRR